MKIVEWLLKPIMWLCEKTGRVNYITGTSPDDVYLIRYYIVRSKYFNCFIHIFMRSDKDDPHDHPWDFATYLVRGSYTEFKFDPAHWIMDKTVRKNYVLKPGGYRIPVRQNTLVFRKATDLHKVVTDRNYVKAEKDQAPLTLFFSGPTKRDWGFVKINDDQTLTWIKWTKYLGLPDDAPSRG